MNRHVPRICRWLALATLFGTGLPTLVEAQRLEGTGTVATGLLLRQMDGVKRVLMIAAHPDDEDTSLLTTLARGWGAETAYLALTRGDGGQNLIGSELWEGLGIVRTGELLAARELDGGQQFFTRAFDYGYSKSADEALSLWPRDELLRDVVWVVRKYRPHVIVSVFSGTPRDGHGQHQAAGVMAREAFAAAGDPTRYPDQLDEGVEAWAPQKLYQTSRRRFFPGAADEDDGSIDIETGVLDPLLGRSLRQLAMESRSQHRSQDMGAAQPPGPGLTGVILIESRVGEGDGDLFSGVDTTLVGVTNGLDGPLRVRTTGYLEAYRRSVARARTELGLDPEAVVPSLLEALGHLRDAREAVPMNRDREFDRSVGDRIGVVERAIAAASGVSTSLRIDDDLLVPGQHATLTAMLWNGGRSPLTEADIEIDAPDGWIVSERSQEGFDADGVVGPGELGTWTYDVVVPENAEVSRLYYLRESRVGANYQWPDDPDLRGLPRDPPLLVSRVSYRDARAGSQRIGVESEGRFVGVNPALGEFDRPILVVPPLSVAVTPAGVTRPASARGATTISVVVRTEAVSGAEGTVGVSPPDGWSVEPRSADFALSEAGAERTIVFDVTPTGTADPGRHVFNVSATGADGTSYGEGFHLVDYPHIERTALFSPAAATISVVPVTAPADVRIGYIMGSGDAGPEALRQIGIDVDELDAARVREGGFEEYSAIVLGVRAYETRTDLQAAADQLLAYARGGGTVVAQYNRGPLGSIVPFAMQVGRGSPRVSDETAPVRILESSAPLFTTPNRISEDDFEGWVQERGLYFASEWDDRFRPMLELNDPGEEARHGSLLVATVGEGCVRVCRALILPPVGRAGTGRVQTLHESRVARRGGLESVGSVSVMRAGARSTLLLLALAGCGPPRDTVVHVRSALPEELLELAESTFEELHPEIDIAFSEADDAASYHELQISSGAPPFDVWWGASGRTLERAAGHDLLAVYRPPWVDQPGMGSVRPDDRWHVTMVTPFVIAFNRDFMSLGDAPTRWVDLFHHGWTREVALLHPTRSAAGESFAASMILEALRSEEDLEIGFEWLARLDPQIADYFESSDEALRALAVGGNLLAVLPRADVEYARERAGDWLYYRIPMDGTPLLTRGVAITSGSDVRNAAARFVDHIGSVEMATEAKLATRWQPAHGSIDEARVPEGFELLQRGRVYPLALDTLNTYAEEWMTRWDLEVRDRSR